MAQLDHTIVPVRDAEESIRFYTEVLGLEVDTEEGEDRPFPAIRVTPDTLLLLAPWGTKSGQHLAFAMAPDEFDAAFARIKEAGIPYGDSFHDVGNMRGPGHGGGARGMGSAVYLFDPNQHLIEIRHY
jgi:catechol 2,3-dioxygenase-like lactoylglutathione lyase family enzyme